MSPPLPARYQGGACSVFFPAPRDLVLLKDERGKTLGTRVLRPMTLPPQVAHSGEFLRPLGVMERGRIAPCEPPWLNTVALETYLEGAAPDLRTNNPPIFHREPRIGVSIDPATRGASDGMLYVREFVRPSEDEGLIVWPSVELDLAGDIGRLGGDGRMVRFHAIDSLALPKPPSLSDPRFRLYCASPSWLRKGHLPGFLDTTTLEGNLDGTTCRLRLVSAALAQTASIGGWDLARQQPRPIRRMIGAGSVYFFEVLSGDAAAAVEQLHGRPFCDDEFM
ncbi:MAG: hypothetical protein MUF51_11930, partial [Vicinamibacteria bacterium]|nr:hypothetical protein [Vicinamibacteria bacterium]